MSRRVLLLFARAADWQDHGYHVVITKQEGAYAMTLTAFL
jgi:hypothetical protein